MSDVTKLTKIKSISEEFGIPEGTLYGEISSGNLPHVRIGNRGIYIEREEFKKWLRSKRRVSSTIPEVNGVKNG